MEKRKRLTIAITEPEDFSPRALKRLEAVGKVITGPFTSGALRRIATNADVLMLRLAHYIDAQIIENSKLKYILTPTTGLNHIDCKYAEKHGIQLISLKKQTDFLKNIPSTAEFSWASMLALLRKIPQANEHVLAGGWDRDRFKSRNLNTLNLGILGFGRVGKQVAGYAKAFNMPFRFYDTAVDLKKHPKATNTVEELLSESDILSIHIPLNSVNKNALNQEKIGHIKPGALLINTSRGEIIDEVALVHALEAKQIAGVATDVLSNEIDPAARNQSPLLAYAQRNNNVIITPHIAGATIDSMQLTEEFVVDQFLKHIEQV